MQNSIKNSNDLSTPTTKTFQLKNLDGTVVQSMPPSLLKAVNADLLSKNRFADAKQLYEQYDINTGYLKSLVGKKALPIIFDFKNAPIDSSKIAKVDTSIREKSTILGLTTIWAQGWIQGSGYGQGQVYQAVIQEPASKMDDYYYVGTIHQSLRLEGYEILTSDPVIHNYLINYDIQFENGPWYGTTGTLMPMWGMFVGSQGQYRPTQCLRIWFYTNNLHAFYIAHNETYAWGSWVSDGATAGVSGKRLEAFAYQFLQY